MTGKGSLTYAPNRRLRVMLGVHVAWISLVCLLAGWWGRVIYVQSVRISELSRLAGVSAGDAQAEWSRTQRMLFGESLVFVALLLGTSLLQLWLYWRDVRRARSLEAFFAAVTHELKTPLTSIRLQAESIADGRGGAEVVRRLLEDTVRLEAQVERTLELARVEGGGPVSSQPVLLRPWLDQFIRSWRNSYGDVVEFKPSVEDLSVEADPGAMQLILRNLVENSVRHSKRARVTVSIGARTLDQGIELDVRDDGPGFPGSPQGLGRIFMKGPGSQGAGVGLYLIKVLMSRMGGRVQFENAGGFRTRLWFPLGDNEGVDGR